MNRKSTVVGICRLVALLCVLCLLTGCHSTKTVFREQHFDAATLKSGGLAIAAVTRPEKLDYYAAPYIAEQVETQLKIAWPQLPVMPMKEVQRLLGDETHLRLQAAFHERAMLPESDFALLSPLAGRVRYALLIDVREDVADSGYSVSSTGNEREEYDFETKTYRTVYVTPDYTASKSSSRFMRTLFIIYDLETRQHVWIATGTGRGGYSNSKTATGSVPSVMESAGVSPQELMGAISKRLLRKVPPALVEKTNAAGE